MMDGTVMRGECSAIHGGVNYRLDMVDVRLDGHDEASARSAAIEAQQKEIIRQQDELLKDLNERVRAIETRGSKRGETVLLSGLSALFGGVLMWLFGKFMK